MTVVVQVGALLLGLTASLALFSPPSHAAPLKPTPTLETVQRRAFDYFWRESDPKTGLTKDRATNFGDKPDTHTIASIAATGYALAALPIAVEHKWVAKGAAYQRALTTLRFAHDTLPNVHGFYYHFVDLKTGERQWKCELSSIDTGLLALGALTAGEYWHGTEVQRLADAINARIDWRWMQTDGGTKPAEQTLCMGWHPETGWIPSRWQGYNEAAYLYWLALGSPTHALTPAAWDAWQFPTVTEEGRTVFGGPSPIFMAQMAPGYFDLRGLRDRQGRDWWTAWRNAHLADQSYCARHPENKTYAAGFWGINASDQPDGYGAYQPEDGHNTGTVAPTAMLAGLAFTPAPSHKALADMAGFGEKLWGRYGFSNAFNLDKGWFDTDVLGLDLGMMLLATENARTGLIWHLMARSPVAKKGLAAAGFHRPAR